MAQLHVHVLESPDEVEVEVAGLGLFRNNTSNELTDEQVAMFEAVQGRPFPEDGVLHVPSTPPVVSDEPEAPADAEQPPTEGTNPFFGKTVAEVAE